MPEGDPFLELVLDESNSVRLHYDLVHLAFEKEGDPVSVNIIPIGRVGDRLIVAASKDSWSRTVAERILPRNALQKPLLIEVGVALHSDPDTVLPEESARLWLGLLEKKLEKDLVPGRNLDALADPWFDDITDGQLRIPFAEALVDAAESQFAFQSAPEDPPLEQRMGALEDSLRQIQIGLQQLTEPGRHPAIATKAAAKPAASKLLIPPTRAGKGGLKIAGLDPGVVNSALAAGIPEEQLRRLAVIAGKTSKMQDVPQTRGPQKQNVLGETDDEGEGIEGGDAEVAEAEKEEDGPEGAPIEKAVLQLTKLVGQMAKPGHRDLETLLDGADSGSADPGSSSSGKSKAAAYKKLRAALRDNPSTIYRSIEAQMTEDFEQVRTAPGTSERYVSSRAWVEHRSKVANFPSSVRAIWALAAIHDCLKSGAYGEARSRAALAIAAWDQAALDQGGWLLSQEILLEEPPPYQSFSHHRLPEPWEQASTRLIDDRWMSVLQWRLKDRDAFIESKKRLSQARAKPDPRGGAEDRVFAEGKGKGKKGKEKEKGKGGQPPPISEGA